MRTSSANVAVLADRESSSKTTRSDATIGISFMNLSRAYTRPTTAYHAWDANGYEKSEGSAAFVPVGRGGTLAIRRADDRRRGDPDAGLYGAAPAREARPGGDPVDRRLRTRRRGAAGRRSRRRRRLRGVGDQLLLHGRSELPTGVLAARPRAGKRGGEIDHEGSAAPRRRRSTRLAQRRRIRRFREAGHLGLRVRGDRRVHNVDPPRHPRSRRFLRSKHRRRVAQRRTRTARRRPSDTRTAPARLRRPRRADHRARNRYDQRQVEGGREALRGSDLSQ